MLTNIDKLDCSLKLLQQLAEMCESSDYSDVTLIVGQTRIPAHKCILAARSPYFRAILYTIGDVPTTIERNFDALNAACLYNLTVLEEAALLYMDRNSTDVLKSTNFNTLSPRSLSSVLKRDTFCAPEMDIFKAVLEWRKHEHSDSEFQAIIPLVRFKLIDLEELLTIVKESSTLDSERLLEIVREKTTNQDMNYRFNLEPNENVASAKNFNAKTIRSGINPLEIVDGNVTTYDGSNGYTYHHITDTIDNCIIVELKSIYLINHIKILLWDRDDRSYSYYVDVSVDLKSWNRVYDGAEFFCRSWQNLHFKSCPVRYIKLVGTHNTANTDFHVVELEAFYTKNEPNLVNGLVSPTVNVATIERGAKVVDGLVNSGDTLDVVLNGDVKNYTGGSGYTYHLIGQGSIVIQLTQPYHIGSCRLLLWDQDDRTYSFYVETSVNKKDWKMAVDKRNDQLKSWQELTFEPRPVVFFKIVGTHNSSNAAFHVVHFETPSSLALSN
ncbi:hypothetical protein HA402_015136 [Bradysia odoriphaga]|nr:hypothetical protein HA402_015136 [Bradysia odoriphaga]